VGIARAGWSALAKDEQRAMMKAANPNAELVPVSGLHKENSKYVNGVYQTGTPSHMFALSAGLAKDSVKRDAVFRLLNYVSQGDGYLLVQYGIEGVNYRMNNGKVEKIDFTNIAHTAQWQFTGRDEMPYLSARFPNQAREIELCYTEKRIEGLNGFVDYPVSFVASDAATFSEQEIIKFLYGRRPISEYNDFVNELLNRYNFKVYMDAAKNQLSQMDILK
jgi:putative aldouronate transport system substrate-binding protein